jgi:hypothetical protein
LHVNVGGLTRWWIVAGACDGPSLPFLTTWHAVIQGIKDLDRILSGKSSQIFELGRGWEDKMSQDFQSWGDAIGQINMAIEFLCKEKQAGERAAFADELALLVRSMARGNYPGPQTSPIDRDEHAREAWARATANHVVDGALRASERTQGPSPSADQVALLREIARRALWHIPNSGDEVRELRRFFFDIENLRQPHPLDDGPEGEG